MLRLLIIDDEYLICELIRNLIHFEELEIELIGQANDAVTALEIIQAQRPDIVITDIRMPEIDGLEIVRRVIESGLDVKFIIISGHKQWDYAFGAIKYGVEDYLLKPINETELNKALQHICEKKAAEAESTRHSHLLRSHLASRQKQLRSYGMESLLRSGEPPVSPEEFNRRYAFHLAEGQFCCLVVAVDYTPSHSADGIHKIPNISKKLELIIMEWLHQHNVIDSESCPWGENLALLVNIPDTISDIRGLFCTLQRHVSNTLEPYGSFRIAFCIAEPTPDFSLANTQFLRARIAACTRGADRAIVFCDTHEFWPDDRVQKWIARRFQESMRSQLLSACTIASSQKLRVCADELFHHMLEDAIASNAAIAAIESFIHAFHITVLQLGYNQDAADLMIRRLITEVYSQHDLCAIQQLVSQRLCEYLDTCRNAMLAQKAAPVRKAQEYIHTHYPSNICLEDLADLVHLNPVYFSTLFKNETGQTISDYIVQTRMEAAKQALSSTSRSIDLIALDVGYRDRKHFGQLFKRHVGLTPSQYRRLKS